MHVVIEPASADLCFVPCDMVWQGISDKNIFSRRLFSLDAVDEQHELDDTVFFAGDARTSSSSRPWRTYASSHAIWWGRAFLIRTFCRGGWRGSARRLSWRLMLLLPLRQAPHQQHQQHQQHQLPRQQHIKYY